MDNPVSMGSYPPRIEVKDTAGTNDLSIAEVFAFAVTAVAGTQRKLLLLVNLTQN